MLHIKLLDCTEYFAQFSNECAKTFYNAFLVFIVYSKTKGFLNLWSVAPSVPNGPPWGNPPEEFSKGVLRDLPEEPRTHRFSLLCPTVFIRHLRGSVTKLRPFPYPILSQFVPQVLLRSSFIADFVIRVATSSRKDEITRLEAVDPDY